MDPPVKFSFTSRARQNAAAGVAEAIGRIDLNPDAQPFQPASPNATAPAQKPRARREKQPAAGPGTGVDSVATPSLPVPTAAPPAATPSQPRTRAPVAKPQPKSDSLIDTEVRQLRIRFQPHGFTQTRLPTGDYNLHCVLPINDPDFPYDLPSLRLLVHLPTGYPGTAAAPIRPCITVLNTGLPGSITARLARHLRLGAASLPGGVLVVRPLLKYLEENLERWMVDDPTERAFKFVPAQDICVSAGAGPGAGPSAEPGVDAASASTPAPKTPAPKPAQTSLTPLTPPTPPTPHTSERIQPGEWIAPAPDTDQSSIGGSASYALVLSFGLLQGVDQAILPSLSLLVCCDRCRYSFAVEALRAFTDRIEHCPKCTNQTKLHYRREFMHPDVPDAEGGSCVLLAGLVRAVRARPVDLLPTPVQVACARCFGAEQGDLLHSQLRIDAVRVGEMVACTCLSCHRGIRVLVDQAQFLANDAPVPARRNPSKQPSAPVFCVGKPLPLQGACEHYKKSFRWYRFPCCGLAFPCDACHAADPVAGKHEADWASRFVCGFCSREQPITNKECLECGREGKRRSTAFWEGGKGVRSQVLMSRKDSKKFKDYRKSKKD